jgi:hydroxyacylglutathione hydrolase
MMTRATRTISIAAEPGAVLRHIVSGVVRWMAGVHEKPGGVGNVYAWTDRVLGMRLRGITVFTEYIPSERVTMRSFSGLGEMREVCTVEPDIAGGCRLAVSWDFAAGVPLLGRLLVPLLVRQFEKNLRRKKAELEAAGPRRSGGGVPAVQLADGIFRVAGVWVGNVYLVVTDDGLLLVDTGLPGSAKRICRFVEAMGRDPGEIRDIVLTHIDGDHVGSAAALKTRTGARVALHELDAPVLTGERGPRERTPLVVRALYPLLVKRLRPDRLLRDGDVVGGLRVMHVPGHTAGSIALVRDDGVVFSGDALLSDKHGNVIPPDPRLAQDPAQASVSAAAIEALHPWLLLPGHGAPAMV